MQTKLTPERITKYLAEDQQEPATLREPLQSDDVWGVSNLTVGKLKEAIKDLPDDMPVAYQRIEDIYFNKHSWTVLAGIWEQRPPYIHRETKEVLHDGLMINDYIGAWDCYPVETHLGIKVFAINAHY